jgi:hypothetical protein
MMQNNPSCVLYSRLKNIYSNYVLLLKNDDVIVILNTKQYIDLLNMTASMIRGGWIDH